MRGLPWPSFLIRSASFVAIAATWRVERPEAITMWSAMLDLPSSGIETTSCAWSSSSEWRTSACSGFAAVGWGCGHVRQGDDGRRAGTFRPGLRLMHRDGSCS